MKVKTEVFKSLKGLDFEDLKWSEIEDMVGIIADEFGCDMHEITTLECKQVITALKNDDEFVDFTRWE